MDPEKFVVPESKWQDNYNFFSEYVSIASAFSFLIMVEQTNNYWWFIGTLVCLRMARNMRYKNTMFCGPEEVLVKDLFKNFRNDPRWKNLK